MLNKARGNMYDWNEFDGKFIDGVWTWNPLGGACQHRCSYCYVEDLKRNPNLRTKYSGQPRIDERAILDNLGINRIVFVESCADLFADNVQDADIVQVLKHIQSYPRNMYLLQSKNPGRMLAFETLFPPHVMLGTTIETDAYVSGDISRAPSPSLRAVALMRYNGHKMVSIEPIMRHNLCAIMNLIRPIRPNFVSIGADSGGHGLPEPTAEDIDMLVHELEQFTTVKLKSNLKRLIGKGIQPIGVTSPSSLHP